jgi:uncharacterized protein with HEPN domain
MCEKPDRIRMRHMLDAAKAGASFIEGKTRADLDTDLQLVFALVRALEIIGEAANRVDKACCNQHPQIRWKEITGMRNWLIHHYFDVNLDLVWETVTADLPELIEELTKILSDSED